MVARPDGRWRAFPGVHEVHRDYLTAGSRSMGVLARVCAGRKDASYDCLHPRRGLRGLVFAFPKYKIDNIN